MVKLNQNYKFLNKLAQSRPQKKLAQSFFFETEPGYFINPKLAYNRGLKRGKNMEDKNKLNI